MQSRVRSSFFLHKPTDGVQITSRRTTYRSLADLAQIWQIERQIPLEPADIRPDVNQQLEATQPAPQRDEAFGPPDLHLHRAPAEFVDFIRPKSLPGALPAHDRQKNKTESPADHIQLDRVAQ